MGSDKKRKDAPAGDPRGSQQKKSKGDNLGKWQTPHHKARLEALKTRNQTLEVGDAGFWVTCQRHQEAKAMNETMSMCEEYGEKLYGIKPEADEQDSGEEDADIEASIQNEIASIKTSNKSRRGDSVFAPMRLPLDCLIFVKTKPPVEPHDFVRRICEDARLVSEKQQRKSRFINRLTPIALTGRATESGLEEVAKTVLGRHFQLTGEDDKPLDGGDYSYAIRPSIRAHNNLKRDDVIKQVAALIGPRHKVNLTAPDKVILIEIFQTYCGIGVVDGDWESMKRYNIRELYEAASKIVPQASAEEE